MLPLIENEEFCMFCLAMSQAKPTSSKSAPGPDRLELSEAQFEALLQRLEQGGLSIEDKELIQKVIQAVLWMGEELEQKKLSIQRLKRLFAVKTESLANLFPGGAGAGGSGDNGPSGPSAYNAALGGTAPAATGLLVTDEWEWTLFLTRLVFSIPMRASRVARPRLPAWQPVRAGSRDGADTPGTSPV